MIAQVLLSDVGIVRVCARVGVIRCFHAVEGFGLLRSLLYFFSLFLEGVRRLRRLAWVRFDGGSPRIRLSPVLGLGRDRFASFIVELGEEATAWQGRVVVADGADGVNVLNYNLAGRPRWLGCIPWELLRWRLCHGRPEHGRLRIVLLRAYD